MIKSIYLIGVGGQGTVLATKILNKGLMQAGYDVKMSEIHGSAQRGGSVTTQIRYGEKVYAPTIGKGEADIIVAFEESEALRSLPYLKKGGRIVMDTMHINPSPIQVGDEIYPEGIADELIKIVEDVLVIPAGTIASDLGNARAQNMVLLGALIRSLNLTDIDWIDLVKSSVPPATIELNVKAFEAGFNATI